MTFDCHFPDARKGTPCTRCGFKLPIDFPSIPRRNCPGRCAHLGEPTGGTIDVLCQTCSGLRSVPFPVYACAVFGETLPSYRCSKDALSESMSRDAAVCQGCESFVAQ